MGTHTNEDERNGKKEKPRKTETRAADRNTHKSRDAMSRKWNERDHRNAPLHHDAATPSHRNKKRRAKGHATGNRKATTKYRNERKE